MDNISDKERKLVEQQAACTASHIIVTASPPQAAELKMNEFMRATRRVARGKC